jgi:hypothetical protein
MEKRRRVVNFYENVALIEFNVRIGEERSDIKLKWSGGRRVDFSLS